MAFVLLRNSRFNFHCYTQHEAMPTQKLARKWRCDLSWPLARKITKGIHPCKPASLNCPIQRYGLLLLVRCWTVFSLQMMCGWLFTRWLGQFSPYKWCEAGSFQEALDSFLSTNGVWLVLCKMIGTILSLQMVWGWFFEELLEQFSIYKWCDSTLSTKGVGWFFTRGVGLSSNGVWLNSL